MKYLLDTDTLIDILQDKYGVRQKVADLIESRAEVALCAVTVAELYSGLSSKNRVKWEEFLSSLPYWNITREAAMQSGIDRKAASDAGRTLPLTDSLIAALAREQDAIILTSNVKDYPTPGTNVLSLREEAA